jgi:MFS family permease
MNGLVYTPAISIIGQYFHRRRALAMGIASSGSSLGGVIFPVMLDRMLYHNSIGFGWSVRVVGFLVLALAMVASLTIVPRVAPRHGPLFLHRAFTRPAYSFQVAGMFFVNLGLMTPMFYLPTYSRTQGMGRDLSFYTLAILNATSLFGRVLSGHYAPHVGRFNLLIFSSVVAAVLVFCWMRIKSNAAILVFSALYGLPSGSIVALMPTTLALVAPEPNQIGTYIGMALGVYSIAALIGTPITGTLISHYHGYDQAIIFSGVMLIAGAFILVWARFAFAKKSEWAV